VSVRHTFTCFQGSDGSFTLFRGPRLFSPYTDPRLQCASQHYLFSFSPSSLFFSVLYVPRQLRLQMFQVSGAASWPVARTRDPLSQKTVLSLNSSTTFSLRFYVIKPRWLHIIHHRCLCHHRLHHLHQWHRPLTCLSHRQPPSSGSRRSPFLFQGAKRESISRNHFLLHRLDLVADSIRHSRRPVGVHSFYHPINFCRVSTALFAFSSVVIHLFTFGRSVSRCPTLKSL